jgi:hypothetical protein
VLVSLTSQALAEECAGFVSWVAPAKDAYFQKHRIYPIPDHIQELAKQYMPRLWVHPQSWQPIDFDEYLAKSKLVRKRDKSILKTAPSARYLANLDHEEQCSLYRRFGMKIRQIRMSNGLILNTIWYLTGAAWLRKSAG